MAAAERAAVRTMLWPGSGCLIALPLLAVPQQDDPLLLVTLHLSALVLFGVGLVFALAPLGDEPWFGGNRWLTVRSCRLDAGASRGVPVRGQRMPSPAIMVVRRSRSDIPGE